VIVNVSKERWDDQSYKKNQVHNNIACEILILKFKFKMKFKYVTIGA
jgi:hypothetical protein